MFLTVESVEAANTSTKDVDSENFNGIKRACSEVAAETSNCTMTPPERREVEPCDTTSTAEELMPK